MATERIPLYSWADLRPPFTKVEKQPRSAMLDDKSFACIVLILLSLCDHLS